MVAVPPKCNAVSLPTALGHSLSPLQGVANVNPMQNSIMGKDPKLRQSRLPGTESVGSVFSPFGRGWVR